MSDKRKLSNREITRVGKIFGDELKRIENKIRFF